MRRRAIISLTPLIDVVFILLVFFMLATSFVDWRVLDLASARAGGNSAMNGAMLIDLRKDSLRLSGQTVTEEDLMRTLSSRFSADPAQRVLIKPEPGVPLQRAVDLVDRITAGGGRNISFVSQPGT